MKKLGMTQDTERTVQLINDPEEDRDNHFEKKSRKWSIKSQSESSRNETILEEHAKLIQKKEDQHKFIYNSRSIGKSQS